MECFICMRQKPLFSSFNSDYRCKCKHLLVEIYVQSVAINQRNNVEQQE